MYKGLGGRDTKILRIMHEILSALHPGFTSTLEITEATRSLPYSLE